MVHRRDKLRASKIMSDRVMKNKKIEVLWNMVVLSMDAGAEGVLEKVQLKQIQNSEKKCLEVKGCFIAIGHHPNTDFVDEKTLKKDEHGYLISEHSSGVHTQIEGVYVAGDCSDSVYRQAITAAGMGCRAAIEAERWLAEID